MAIQEYELDNDQTLSKVREDNVADVASSTDYSVSHCNASFRHG